MNYSTIVCFVTSLLGIITDAIDQMAIVGQGNILVE